MSELCVRGINSTTTTTTQQQLDGNEWMKIVRWHSNHATISSRSKSQISNSQKNNNRNTQSKSSTSSIKVLCRQYPRRLYSMQNKTTNQTTTTTMCPIVWWHFHGIPLHGKSVNGKKSVSIKDNNEKHKHTYTETTPAVLKQLTKKRRQMKKHICKKKKNTTENAKTLKWKKCWIKTINSYHDVASCL